MTRIALAASLALVSAGLCRADIANVRSALQTALAEQDGSRLQKTDFLFASEDDIKAAAKEELRSLLPLAWKCLQSRLPAVREYGIAVLFIIVFRPDSSELLSPYVDSDLAPLLDDKDLAVKRAGIVILGTSKPKPSAHALDLLSAHLADENNTQAEAGMIAGGLLHERPSDVKSVHNVLEFVSRHQYLNLRIDTIRLLGLNGITVDEAVKFIREGLNDQSEDIRKTSVEAVGRMPAAARVKFSDDLLRLLANPNETAAVRALAESVIHQ